MIYKGSVCNAGLGNLDLARMVNGSPGDPLEMRLFDFSFQREKILSWWAKIGFLPMTRWALQDPKVRYEVGEDGASEDDDRRLVLLEKSYIEGAKALDKLGYNGTVFDLRLPRSKKKNFMADDEAQIQELMKDRVMNQAGSLCKIGIHVINAGNMLEVKRRLEENKKKAEKEKMGSKKSEEMSEVEITIYHWGNWVQHGKPVDKNGKLKLSKEASVFIAKASLPRINATKKVSEYKTKVKCIDWLASLTDWEAKMQAMSKNLDKVAMEAQPKLF